MPGIAADEGLEVEAGDELLPTLVDAARVGVLDAAVDGDWVDGVPAALVGVEVGV